MKYLIALLFCASIAVVQSKEINSTLHGQLNGKMHRSLPDIPGVDSILFSLVCVEYQNKKQSGFYVFSSQVVNLQNPFQYTCNPQETNNINLLESKVYTINKGPLLVKKTSHHQTFVSLWLHDNPEAPPVTQMKLIMKTSFKTMANRQACIAGWNTNYEPIILVVTVEEVTEEEIIVDLDSAQLIYGDFSCYDINQGDLLIQQDVCVGFFIKRVGSTGVFSPTHIPIPSIRKRSQKNEVTEEKNLKKLCGNVRNLRIGD